MTEEQRAYLTGRDTGDESRPIAVLYDSATALYHGVIVGGDLWVSKQGYLWLDDDRNVEKIAREMTSMERLTGLRVLVTNLLPISKEAVDAGILPYTFTNKTDRGA